MNMRNVPKEALDTAERVTLREMGRRPNPNLLDIPLLFAVGGALLGGLFVASSGLGNAPWPLHAATFAVSAVPSFFVGRWVVSSGQRAWDARFRELLVQNMPSPPAQLAGTNTQNSQSPFPAPASPNSLHASGTSDGGQVASGPLEWAAVTPAMEKYRRAAEEGDPDAQATLAMHYDSRTEKLKWASKAAEQGHSEGQYLMGMLREVEDAASAATWYRKAAEQGHPLAQSGLAYLMENGLGIEQDRVRAYMWFSVAAAALGDTNRFDIFYRGYAQRHAANVATLMTPSQLVEGEALARAWLLKHRPLDRSGQASTAGAHDGGPRVSSSTPTAAEVNPSDRPVNIRLLTALLRAGLATSSATPEAIERFYRQYDEENPGDRARGAVRASAIHTAQVKALIEQFKDAGDPEAFLAALKRLKDEG